MRFKDSVALVADEELVWRRVSDLQAIPLYWTEIESVQVLKEDGRLISARVEFASGGSGTVTLVVNDSNRTLLLYFEDGPLLGTQRVSVQRGELETVWDVRSGSRKSMNLGDLRVASQEALKRLAGIHETFAQI